MREEPAPHQGHLLSSVDTLALWRCDEASGALTDATGNYTSTAGTAPAAAGGLFSAPAGSTGARDFNGSTHYVTAPGDADADDALYPAARGDGYTVEAWIQSDDDAAEQTIVSYGYAGQTAFSFRVNGLKLRMFWDVSGTDTTTETTDDVLTASAVHHVAVTVRRVLPATSQVNIEFYVDGEMVERFTGVSHAAGAGGSPIFCIGRHQDTAQATAFFNGRIDDVRISKFAASAACVRDSYARGVRRFDLARVRQSGAYETHLFAFAEWPEQSDPALWDRGVGYADLSDVYGHDHVVSADGGEDVDDVGQQATLHVRRSFGRQNIAPWYGFGPLNDAGFLALTRRVKLEVAVVPKGYGREAARIHRLPIHDGVIARVEWPDNVMRLTLPDLSAFLTRTWCEEDENGDDPIFSPDSDESIEDVCQQVIDTFEPAGGYKASPTGDGRFEVWAPAALTFLMNAFYVPATTSVQQKLEEIATCAQARIRMRWDDHRKEFRLCLYRPDREATWQSGDPTITSADTVELEQIESDDADIRNVVDVEYGDTGDNDNTGQPIRKKATASSAPSIAEFGRRYCKVGLGTTNPLNDATGAGDLAAAVVSDLATPKAIERRSTHFRGDIELEDMVRVTDPTTLPAAEDRACTGVHWRIASGEVRSTFSLRGTAPSGGVRRWFDWGIVNRGFRPGLGKGGPTAPDAPTLAPIAGGLQIEWAPPVGKINRQYLETEVHISTSGGFTPDETTLRAKSRAGRVQVHDLPPDFTHYVKLVHRDAMGNRTVASAQTFDSPRYMSKTPGMWAARSADYLPGSGKTVLAFDAPENDHFGDYDDSTYTFTVQLAGWYSIAAGVRCTDTSAFDVDLLVECDDGVTIFESDADTITGTDAAARVNIPSVWLRAGDIVTASIVKNTSTANFLVKGLDPKTYFAIRYHGGRE